MSNPILDKIDEFGTAVVQMREANDKAVAELKKGNETLAKELSDKADKWNTQIGLHQKAIADLTKDNEQKAAQIEMLEALSSRPKGTPTEQLEQKHLKLWDKWVRSEGKDNAIEAEMKAVYRQVMEAKTDSVQIGTGLLGGNAVPTVIGTAIENLILKQSDIVANVRNIPVGTPNYSELVTIAGANGGWGTETGGRSQSRTPNLRKVTPTYGELYAFPKVTTWSLQDIFFNVQDWVTRDASDTMAISLATAIYSGSGSNQPTGMTHSAPTASDDYASPMRTAAVFEYLATADSPVTTAPSAGNLIDLQVLLRPGYQANAKWTMNSVTLGAIRKLTDSYGQYLWQPNFQAGMPAMLLGKPVFVWEDMPSYGSSALSIAYGDFSRAYLLVKIGSMTMVTDQVTTPGFVNFLIGQRWGGIPLNNDAVKFLKQAAS